MVTKYPGECCRAGGDSTHTTACTATARGREMGDRWGRGAARASFRMAGQERPPNRVFS